MLRERPRQLLERRRWQTFGDTGPSGRLRAHRHLWDGLEGPEKDYQVDATSSLSGVTQVTFTRAVYAA
jgi:hypothetical protein